MASVVVPITPSVNQSVTCTLPVNNQNITLSFNFIYNTPGAYWSMTIADKSGNTLIDGVPLVSGSYPAANLLRQYQYLNIGSAYIVPVSDNQIGRPDFDELGVDYYLVWSDNAS